jgi:hypothetical protein
MNVPARGGVIRTANESPGAISGAIRDPVRPHPATPSYTLSSSKPCQWMVGHLALQVLDSTRFNVLIGSPFQAIEFSPGLPEFINRVFTSSIIDFKDINYVALQFSGRPPDFGNQTFKLSPRFST